jgi:hypothetical protein
MSDTGFGAAIIAADDECLPGRDGVDTKRLDVATFGDDNQNIDTKSPAGGTFGNDGVDTKSPANGTFGDYGLGFVRVRKRKLGFNYHGNTTSVSYDLVRAVRVNGVPRQKFILGLGSFKHGGEPRLHIGWFWSDVFDKMQLAGLNVEQQHKLADEMVRKGAPRITAAQYEDFVEGWPYMKNKKTAPAIATWAGKVAA